MIIRCAWCKEWLGEKEPLDDLDITDTICPKCLVMVKGEIEAHNSRRRSDVVPIIFEAKGSKVELCALTKKGTWLTLCELHLDKEELYELYHFPLLFKICCSEQESQLKNQETGEV